MNQSQFARLPKELRLIVYEYALTTDFSVSVRASISKSQDMVQQYHLVEGVEQSSDSISGFEEESDMSSSISEDSEVDSDSSSDPGFICGNAFYAQSYSEESFDSDSDNGVCRANFIALTSTCRQLRREALPVFYAVNGISLENDRDVHATSPMLQMLLLTKWQRHIPGAQTGLFRHVTVSALDELRCPDKTIPNHTLAEAIYKRFAEIASCFDTARTELSLDLGKCVECDPVSAKSLYSVLRVRTTFVMTPWAGLRQQIEAHVNESESRFQEAKARVMRWQHSGKSVERAQKSLEGSEDDARYRYGVLRRLVEIVEEAGGHRNRLIPT